MYVKFHGDDLSALFRQAKDLGYKYCNGMTRINGRWTISVKK